MVAEPPTLLVHSQVDCVEAIYNLGLVNLHLDLASDALQAFEKLHTILPNNTEVIYHIANLHEVKEYPTSKYVWCILHPD